MFYIDAGDEGLIWICEWCHAGEPALEAERRNAWRAAWWKGRAWQRPRAAGGL